MFSKHVSHQLAAYIDGKLAQPKAWQIEAHVANCELCRTERDQIRIGMEILEHLPQAAAPDAVWASIEAALQPPPSRAPRWRLAFAATALLVFLATYWALEYRSQTQWDVTPIHGSPAVAAHRLHGDGKIASGQWIETDSASSATVKIGQLGSVEVAPNSRLRMVSAQSGKHRLALAQGQIRAKISAPPRLFFVETASGTAVDLGCEYTLQTDEAGAGLLQVTKGWVSFEWQGIESLVPAGASCRMRPRVGPGIPYFDDAPASMKQALDNFDFEKAGNTALDTILADARVRDTLTLWHLLSRVEVEDRSRVYDRIASLTAVPAGVSRDKALQLDAPTLQRWKEELAWTW